MPRLTPSERIGSKNTNWKGGITLLKTTEDILTAPKEVQKFIRIKLLRNKIACEKTGCWNWTGGIFSRDKRARFYLGCSVLAARVAYVIYKGSTEGLLVCHSCDNKLCVNPDHLWLGTSDDNAKDMVSKGRQAKGDKNGSRKHPEKLIRGKDHINSKEPERVQCQNNGRAQLTNEQVLEIRARFRKYVNVSKPSNASQLAEEYGVSKNSILLIGKGLTWKAL